jgi:pimeloyl-ACP methyl ester carboxylesterase
MNLEIDARGLLPRVRAPAVVLHASGDRVIPAAHGRDLAARLPRARHVEVPGDDHAFLFEARQVLVREVSRLLDRARSASGSAHRDGGDLGADRHEGGAPHERLD